MLEISIRQVALCNSVKTGQDREETGQVAEMNRDEAFAAGIELDDCEPENMVGLPVGMERVGLGLVARRWAVERGREVWGAGEQTGRVLDAACMADDATIMLKNLKYVLKNKKSNHN